MTSPFLLVILTLCPFLNFASILLLLKFSLLLQAFFVALERV